MKNIVLIVLFLASSATGISWSQEWRDSLNHARQLYKNGQYKQALKYYKSAERLAPNDVDLSEEKGQSAYRAGDYQEAEQAYRTATVRQKDKKRRVAAYNNLGNSRLRQENYQGAEEAFKEALRQDPSNEKARQLLAEAKRLRREKEQQEQNQQQQEQKQQQQNQNNQQQNQQGNQQKKDQQQQQQSGQGQQNQQNSGQSGQSGDKQQQGGSAGKQQKLADKQTERKLDELMRQEMDAKKRIDGSKENTNGKKAKKDW